MGLFKHRAGRKAAHAAAYAQKEPALIEGLQAICDAWEADVWRTRKEWTDRREKRVILARELAHWMQDEVVADGGAISAWDNYVDGLTTEIGEGVVDGDPELYSALIVLENEEQQIQDLARPALEFTDRLCRAEGQGEVDKLVRETRARAERKIEDSLVA